MSALRRQNKLEPPLDDAEIYSNYIIAVANGIAKVMAKMGISTLHSYKVCTPLVMMMMVVMVVVIGFSADDTQHDDMCVCVCGLYTGCSDTDCVCVCVCVCVVCIQGAQICVCVWSVYRVFRY